MNNQGIGHVESSFQDGLGTPTNCRRNIIRRTAAGVELVYEGGAPVRISMRGGWIIIATLLMNPHQAITAQQLAAGFATTEPSHLSTQLGDMNEIVRSRLLREWHLSTIHDLGDAGEELTPETTRNYKSRLRTIPEEIKGCSNPDKIAELQHEATWLEDELSRARGLSGRTRKAADVSERMRKAFAIAIDRAIQDLRPIKPGLAHHLEESIGTESPFKYDPQKDRCSPWELEDETVKEGVAHTSIEDGHYCQEVKRFGR